MVILMGFNGDLMDFNGDLMGFNGDLIDFNGDLMGFDWDLPSGKRLHSELERSTIFNGKIQYKWPCSIAILT